ncbi:hypothetical protein VOLCADRAFT_98512 [Volvox carteri f. nagariensis]|uniref:Nucleotide-diphospho-sugar transferase domain-containing protein n=1 Tax=Volvox carteri f. nagariensis TaxID=3068 RepID=D8UFJ2_VOLCA|nr:uncharacterized protein VOLCADRAFT_98512 [Volvox carteri f. nagariensis]EFJ41466.1 hypothetical protein VOLCADRAFT_98512 [Volvox carteri f. nagariensis]|eukprot:XP_002957411.1 hypothetical protein VOLCADRAFT_98512 [Volvox carteri f. nagariensis]
MIGGRAMVAESLAAEQLLQLPHLAVWRLRLLLLLSVLVLLPGAEQAGLACERSGYCSLGRTKPYLGEVDTAVGLRRALVARSYRREVILMATDAKHVLGAIQAVTNLRRLGLDNVLMLGDSGPECVRVASALPSTGCVWMEWDLPVVGAERDLVPVAAPLWHNRYRLAARAVRMRYNVFLVDTDVIFFDDPYLYFKSPPFANFTIINQPEVLYDQLDYLTESDPNGGVLYVQSAAPDGPAAWLLSEVTHRLLRWLEDGFRLSRHTHHIATWCNYMDQDGLKDALSSVRLGRIFFGFAVRDCRTEAWRNEHPDQHVALRDAVTDLLGKDAASGGGAVRQDDHVELPTALQGAAGEQTVTLRYFEMRMPAYAPWDEKYGPYLYPSKGVLSGQWLQQLREDCGCPLWPDPEDPSSAAASVPSERFLLAPPFLMLNWFARGRKGYWHPALTPTGPQQVVGHLHYVPGTSISVGKSAARMAVGQYDWKLAQQVLGPRLYFLHQGTDNIQPGPETQPGGLAPLHLLALHPSLLRSLAYIRSWEEYAQLLRGLLATAIVLGRVPVWPDAPCAAPWIAESGAEGASTLPLTIRQVGTSWLPGGVEEGKEGALQALIYVISLIAVRPSNVCQEFIPYGTHAADLWCMWLPLLTEGCLFDGRGMLTLEFAHWRSKMLMLPYIDPDERNTIGLVSAELGATGVPTSNGSNPTLRIFSLPRDDLARAWSLKRTHVFRVLYLMNPLRPVLSRGTVETNRLNMVQDICKATNHEEMVQDLKDKPYKEPTMPNLELKAAAVGVDGLIRAAPAIPGYNVPPGTEPQQHDQQVEQNTGDSVPVDGTTPEAAVDAAAAAAILAAAAAAAAAAAGPPGDSQAQAAVAARADSPGSASILVGAGAAASSTTAYGGGATILAGNTEAMPEEYDSAMAAAGWSHRQAIRGARRFDAVSLGDGGGLDHGIGGLGSALALDDGGGDDDDGGGAGWGFRAHRTVAGTRRFHGTAELVGHRLAGRRRQHRVYGTRAHGVVPFHAGRRDNTRTLAAGDGGAAAADTP